MGEILDFYKEHKVDGINMNVIRFIDEVSSFPDRDGIPGEHIDHLFCAGYCYYFAHMLEMAFGGKVCWIQDRGHIAWADCDKDCTLEQLQNAIVYDITGIADDYERVWPIEYLGDAIVDYMHNGKEFHLNHDFKDWCDFCKVEEIFAINVIWGCMPIDEIMNDYKNRLDYVQTAYQYWIEHSTEFQELFRFIKKKNPFLYPDHLGITETLIKSEN